MNPKQFLMIGGVVLLLVGILGFIGVIGPTPDKSIFGANWYFDNGENWVHSILGIVALIAAFALKQPMAQKWLVVAVGVLALAFAVLNLFLPKVAPNFMGANLESPADTVLHLVVGVWALGAACMKKKMPMA